MSVDHFQKLIAQLEQEKSLQWGEILELKKSIRIGVTRTMAKA